MALAHGVFVATSAGVVTTDYTKIKAIVYTSGTAGDSVSIYDGSNTDLILKLSIGTAGDTVVVPFGDYKVFPDGLYINAISAGGTVMIVPASGIWE